MEGNSDCLVLPTAWLRRTRRTRPPLRVWAVLFLLLFSLSTALAIGGDHTSVLDQPESLNHGSLIETSAGPRHLRSRNDHLVMESNVRILQDSDCADENPFNAVPFAVQIIIIIILVLFSALFSGLTLGLMGLDKTGLEIVMEGEDLANAQAARRIYPIRKNGNLLLCTLLLGNVGVNALLSIFLADKAGGIVGFIASTGIIVIFGEILPQALCSRYALQIGSRAVPLVRVIMVILYPLAGPLAFCLNKALGHELATTYSSAEMRKLLEIHVQEGRFDQETGTAMTGALKYKDIAVKDVMTPLEHTFMLSADEKLSFETIASIFKTGYSRIPVYEISIDNVIGLLFVKDLIFIDPEDETPVRNFVQIFGRGAHVVWPDDKLGDVLRELKKGRSHMALVRDVNNKDEEQDPFYEIKGIITLEDIIEEILGDEIVDETDAFVDGTHSERVDRIEKFDWGRLRLLDSKIVDEKLSHDEVKAVSAHLRTNHSTAVSLLSDKQLYRFVAETPVTELPTAQQEVGQAVPDDLMYQKNVPSDVCTLILGGKVTVLAGTDGFRSDVSSWTLLAASALTEPNYAPDFTAYVSSGPCRCLLFTREMFTTAVDATALEKRTTLSSHHSDKIKSGPSGTHEATSSLGGTRADTERIDARETSVLRQSDVVEGNKSHKREIHHSRRRKLMAAIQTLEEVKQSSEQVEDTSDNESTGRMERSGSTDDVESDASLINETVEK